MCGLVGLFPGLQPPPILSRKATPSFGRTHGEYLNSAPNFVFAQFGQNEWSTYVARYEALRV